MKSFPGVMLLLILTLASAQEPGASSVNESRIDATAYPPLGQQHAAEIENYLTSIGDKKALRAFRQSLKEKEEVKGGAFIAWTGGSHSLQPWQYGVELGYLPLIPSGSTDAVVIKSAANVAGDHSLQFENVKVTLDRLRVYDYPGEGLHDVLVECSADHQPEFPATPESLHFSQHYIVQEGSGAGVSGYPMFTGLRVPSDGLQLECSTINIENKDDKGKLQFMQSTAFKSGLQMMNSVNPLVPVVSGFATGLVESLLKNKNKNVRIIQATLGLDFNDISTHGHLREGSYIVLQVPTAGWTWSDFKFNPVDGMFQTKGGQPLPFNYLVFSVSKEPKTTKSAPKPSSP